jgi:hypothetical protein
MATRPDFVLFDRHDHLAAIVEVKAKRGTSSRWAAEFRRNLLAHEAFRQAPFFLLITPDKVYLWKETPKAAGAESSPIPPDYELDAKPIFGRYLKSAGLKPEDISSNAFELIVMSWLGDLILQLPDATQQPEIEDSGLLQAAKDGRITFPAAA